MQSLCSLTLTALPPPMVICLPLALSLPSLPGPPDPLSLPHVSNPGSPLTHSLSEPGPSLHSCHPLGAPLCFDLLRVCLVAQSCPTLCDPVDCSPPGSSVHGILQARILEWVAMPSSRVPSQPRDRAQVSHVAGTFFTI